MSRKTILLVEDNADYQELMRLAFANCGLEHNLVLLSSAREALDYLGGKGRYSGRNLNQQPRLILLDLNLPPLNGLRVLQRIRAEPRTRFVPVVIMSTSTTPEELTRSYQSGCNSYIRKPLDFTQLQNWAREIAWYWLNINQIPPVSGGIEE